LARQGEYWISFYKKNGYKLTNETHGGEGREKGFKHKPKSIQGIINGLKNRSIDLRKKIGIKISKTLKGRSLSENNKSNLSKSHKRFWKNLSLKEQKKYISRLNHGWSAKSREKLSKANRGRKHNNSSSKYRGVSWFKRDQCWRGWLNYNSKQIHLGYFDSAIAAAKAYNQAALELHKEFAVLNQI